MDLKDKIAIITGAGGGIGRAVAISLAKEGAKIILLGGTKREKLIKTAQEVDKYSKTLDILDGDLTDDKTLDLLFDKIVQKTDKIDILINNAGQALNCAFEKTEREVFDRIMNINVRAPYLLTQKALPIIKKSDSATIINIASVVSHAGYPMQSAYVASKHALLGFTKSLAAEVYNENVRVHAISPGGVYTDMVKVSRPDLSPEGMIMPEEIAEIVLFLLKNRGNAVIDEILVHRLNKQPFLI